MSDEMTSAKAIAIIDAAMPGLSGDEQQKIRVQLAADPYSRMRIATELRNRFAPPEPPPTRQAAVARPTHQRARVAAGPDRERRRQPVATAPVKPRKTVRARTVARKTQAEREDVPLNAFTTIARHSAMIDSLGPVEAGHVRDLIRSDSPRHAPRIAGILRVAQKLGESPEAKAAIRDELLNPNGSAGAAALAYLESGPARDVRRSSSLVLLGRLPYEKPDALDRLQGTVMAPPTEDELTAAFVLRAGR